MLASRISCICIWILKNALGEKEMATHFSVPAWRIPWTVSPGGLPSVGSLRVGYD